ncbi:MAG: ATP-binding protein [bacterium]
MTFASSYDLTIPVAGNDFVMAGKAASQIKKTLEALNLPPKLVRRASICAYEAEMNIVIHAYKGRLGLRVTAQEVTIVAKDEGPGITDVSQAMKEGYSTAPNEIREMGFGAGMGLPNMQRCADRLSIVTKLNYGTKVTITIFLPSEE